MNKKNLIAIALGILVIVAVIWVRQRYAPKQPINLRDESTWDQDWTPAPPTPIPSPTPITVRGLSLEKLQNLKKCLDIIGESRKEIEEVMIPAVKRLYRREEAEVFRWAEDASWPSAQYKDRFDKEIVTMKYYITSMPDDFIQLKTKLENLQQLALKASNSFRHSPNSPKEMSSELAAQIDVLTQEVKEEHARLNQELNQEIERRQKE